MASFSLARSILPLLVLLTLINSSIAKPRILEVWNPSPSDYPDDSYLLKYHNGEVLQGEISISMIWYGYFTWSQKTIIVDFLYSLTTDSQWQSNPSVAQWWGTLDQLYLSKVANQQTKLNIDNQADNWYWLGKSLTMSQISELASNASTPKGGITLVFTAEDVAVEDFCVNQCAVHGSDHQSKSTFIWVGNSASQCPGQCAWPFHQPLYGPQVPALLAPNGDVGIDGMVVNLASMIAGAATNPFGNGYYQGNQEAPMEACTACPGVYGAGAYPGYAGQLLTDSTTGVSYNTNGINGRKYLLPAFYDPTMGTCSTTLN